MGQVLMIMRAGRSIFFGSGPHAGWHFLGFANETGYTGSFTAAGPIQFKRIVIPYLPFVAATALWPYLLWRKQKIQSTRLLNHHCPHCNDDLRVTPTHCPECGWKTTGNAA